MTRRGFLPAVAAPAVLRGQRKRPNIVMCLADNFSWEHLRAYGCDVIRTPAFDRVVREGVLFRHAFCNAPSCAPSRAAILTGQDIWRLEEGGSLWGSLPQKFPIYPELLEQAGYWSGHAGKGYLPSSDAAAGRTRNPCGVKFKNFAEFLQQRPAGTPFAFWHGNQYSNPLGKPVVTDGVQLDRLRVPAFLPECDGLRKDFYYYFQRLRAFDAELSTILSLLEKAGELDNTLLVAASDNGMDFPRGYPNLYEHGIREFLAIRWPGAAPGGRTVDDFVKLSDLAPTFLAAAGVNIPSSMNARSLMPVLESRRSGRIEPQRNFAVTGRERHAMARRDQSGYPMRALRTEKFHYIRNYAPDRWPAGDPDFAHYSQGIYGDIDRCETKWFMHKQREDPKIRPLFDLAFGKRPPEEMYDVKADPDQIRNLAADPRHRSGLGKLRAQLTAHLRETGDPRETGKPAQWDQFPYHAPYWKAATTAGF